VEYTAKSVEVNFEPKQSNETCCSTALFNRCARCTLGCTTTKGFITDLSH